MAINITVNDNKEIKLQHSIE